jgi:hypothetical protein
LERGAAAIDTDRSDGERAAGTSGGDRPRGDVRRVQRNRGAVHADSRERPGEAGSLTRSADQTTSARFWGGTAAAFWNRAAASASRARHLSLSDNARLFALLNVAIADAVISAWDAKYHFELWRPITAIRLADTDGNPATLVQPGWTPLLTTPNYPEYDSGHQSNDGTAQYILTAYFGNDMPVEGFSEGFPGVTLKFPNFKAAADDALMARIWAGIHFRTAMLDTRARGEDRRVRPDVRGAEGAREVERLC